MDSRNDDLRRGTTTFWNFVRGLEFRSLENRVLLVAKEVVENRSLLSFGTTVESFFVGEIHDFEDHESVFAIMLFCKFYCNEIILFILVKKLDRH